MKFVLLILGALLLVQLAHPLPVADSSSPSTEDTPRERFLTQAFNELFDLFANGLKGYSHVFQNVVDKASHVENQSDALKKYLARFEGFINEVKKITEAGHNATKIVDVIHLIEETTNISNEYDKACRDDPEAFPEKLFLDKNGRIEFREKSVAHFVEFEPKFLEPLDAYFASLTPEAAKEDYRFVDWYNAYKKAESKDKKIELLFDYIILYD